MRPSGECCHIQYYSFFLWLFLCVGCLDRHHPSLEWTKSINSWTKGILNSVWTNSVVITFNQLVWSILLYWQPHSQKFVHPAMQFKGNECFLSVFRVTVLDFCFFISFFIAFLIDFVNTLNLYICILQSSDGSHLLPPSPLALSSCLCPLLHCLQWRKIAFCIRPPFKNHALNLLFIAGALKLSIRLMFFRIRSL